MLLEHLLQACIAARTCRSLVDAVLAEIRGTFLCFDTEAGSRSAAFMYDHWGSAFEKARLGQAEVQKDDCGWW